MIEYVLGFAFNADTSAVALIEKQKPDWQKGKLNGIGGKIEPTDETQYDAMIREFKEETGIYEENWQQFIVMKGKDWVVHCFWARLGNEFYKLRSMEEERVHVQHLAKQIDKPIIGNLRWLIQMAIDSSTEGIDYSIYTPEIGEAMDCIKSIVNH